MKPADKQRLLNRFLIGVPKGTVAHRQLEQMWSSELDAIAPLIDEIVKREVKRFGEHVFHNVLTPEQVIEVFQRLKAEGRLSPQTIAHAEADLGKAKGATP